MRSFFSKRIGIIILTIIILAATLVVLSSCIQSGDSDEGQEPDDEQETNDGQDQSEPEYTPTEGLSYILNEDESGYTVSGIGTATDTDIVIPSEYNGLPVTGIWNEAFSYCNSLKSIVIPDSVTSIGDYAFSCESLTSITVDENNTAYASIDGNLYNKDKTTFIQYAIGKTATEFTIPDSVTSIEDSAFGGCSSLKKVIIGNGVTSIGSSAFYDCALLQYNEYNNAYYLGNENNPYLALIKAKNTDITSCAVHINTKSIALYAFAACESLTSITVDENNTAYVSIDGNLYNKDKTTLIQYATGKTATEFTIPDSVTSIGEQAFSSCRSLTSVIIGNGVTSIGDRAFASCHSLTSVNIPDSVTSIGDYAFNGCASLTSIVIPDSVTSIGNTAFAFCTSLTSVTIGNGVTSIGNSAFDYCTSLTSITVDENNTAYASIDGNLYNKDKTTLIQYAIGKTATEFTIPDSVTSIGDYAFSSCTSLTSIVIPDSVTSIGDYAFHRCTSLTSVTIPDGVTSMSIGDYVFFLCTSLNMIYYNGDIESWLNKDWHSRIMSSGRTLYINNVKTEGELTIPDGVTTIPSRAFAYQNITSVIVPDSVTSIGDDAFVACTSLTSITVDENNTAYVSIDGNLYNKDKTTLIQYATGKTATEFTIPDGVTSIGNSAFSYCYSLTSIVIPDSVTSIGDSAFESCDSLTSVTIGNGVTGIGDYAFSYCTSLTSVTIGNNVTSIGGWVFYDCYSLTDVYYGGTEEQWNGISIGNGNEDLTSATIHFSADPDDEQDPDDGQDPSEPEADPTEGLDYELNEDGNGYTVTGKGTATDKDIVIPSEHNGLPVTSIGNSAFNSCFSLTSIFIPDSAISIGDFAFAYCDSLTSITVDENNTAYASIDGNLYNKDKTTLIQYAIGKTATEFTIPNGVTSIGDYAFSSCTSLTSIVIPDSVTSIEMGAFFASASLKNITVDENNTAYASIDGNLYNKDKTTLIQYAIGKTATEFTIPDNVTSIGVGAFYTCTSLTSVTIGNSVTSIGYGAFAFCTSLTNIDIPDKVTSIGEDAFTYCDSLTSVTIGNGVTSIGSSAFFDCRSLTSIVIPDSVTSIGDNAFYSCTSLTSITVDENNTAYVSIDGNLYNKDKTTLIQYAIGKTATEFTVPDSATSISSSAFSGCDSLTSIVIPDSVTNIGDSAFGGCSSLKKVIIGNGVTSIGESAFYRCTSLTDVYYGGTGEQWYGISIGNDNEDLTSANIHFSAADGTQAA